MCGRYYLDVDFDDILSCYDITALEEYYDYGGERFPSQRVLTVANRRGKLKAVPMIWGIKTPYFRRPVINARAETVCDKQLFRNAIQNRRLLMPATGYYEWQERAIGSKQRHRISLDGRPYFNFAGLFNVYQIGDEKVAMAAIITLDAAPMLRSVHSRMPLILPRHLEQSFLQDEQFDISRYRNAVYNQTFVVNASH